MSEEINKLQRGNLVLTGALFLVGGIGLYTVNKLVDAQNERDKLKLELKNNTLEKEQESES